MKTKPYSQKLIDISNWKTKIIEKNLNESRREGQKK